MISGKEARRILSDLQQKNRERQRAWKAKMLALGYRRLSAMVSGKAAKLLTDEAKRLDLPKGEVLSDIIENALDNVTGNKGHIVDTDALIARYRTDGMSFQAIADRLNADGIPTAMGKTWHKGTIGNVVKRLERG